jgi:hypothetical protein
VGRHRFTMAEILLLNGSKYVIKPTKYFSYMKLKYNDSSIAIIIAITTEMQLQAVLWENVSMFSFFKFSNTFGYNIQYCVTYDPHSTKETLHNYFI